MGCTYEIFGKTYTKEQLEKALKDKGFQNRIKLAKENLANLSYDPDELSDTDDNPVLSKYDKLVQYKKSLIAKLNDRIANVKGVISSSDSKEDIKELTKLQNEMKERVSVLESEIESFSIDGLSLETFKFQTSQDFERVQKLLNSGSLEDANEAKRIINFYKALEINVNKVTVDNVSIIDHPFFEKDEMYDSAGNVILSDELVTFFDDVANTFKKEETKLINVQQNIVEDIINSNPKVKALYDKLSYAQITEAIPDLNWVDMMIMDVTKGIFSSNGIIPQVMMDVTQSVFAEKISHAKKFEEKHNALLPKVENTLRVLGYKIGFGKEVSFDLFFQKALGRNTGRLVHRYDQSFFDKRAEIQNDFHNEIRRAKTYEDEESRNKALQKAFNKKQQWYRENTMVFDVRKIQEIQDEFPEFAALFENADGEHEKEMISQIGMKGYQEELAKQKSEIKKYIAWRDAYKETYLQSKGVDNVGELSAEDLSTLQQVLITQNPFYGAKYFYETSGLVLGDKHLNSSMNYNISIPRKTKASAKYKASETEWVLTDTKESTGFYDNDYQKIEENPDLKQYYDLIKTEMDFIMNSFPQEIQDQLFTNSLPLVKKSYAEIMADPNIGFFRKLWNLVVDMYDRIRAGFGINREEGVSYENTDVISGKVESTINADFLNNNKKRVQDKFVVEAKKISNLLKASGSKITLRTTTTIPLDNLPPSIYNEISKITRTPVTKESLKKQFGNTIPLGNIVYKGVMSDMIEEHSTNLPKIVKYYSMMAAEYSARTELLPYMEIMKQHYESIQTTATNNVGESVVNAFTGKTLTKGSRKRATTQMEDWFNRVILGNYGVKEFGLKKSTLDKKDNAKDKIKSFVTGRILSQKEKHYKKELDDLINSETDESEKQKLITIREKLGKEFALSAAIDNFLNYIRFLGLGYNLSSAITNYLEGQTANIIIAASGDFFESKHYYRAMNIVKGSFVKAITMGQVQTNGAKKVKTLIDKFNILQDSTNELQKASTKTAFNYLEKLHPMELNKKTEYLNQAPLMVAVMLDTPITSINGETSNVYDALDTNGNLKPEFRTEENIKTWEENTGEAFTTFKSKVNQSIVMAHGNYDALRGMMSKTSVAGKAFMMFKTWVGSALYSRFATEKDDVELGQKGYKGRYWSHTSSSALLHGTIAGFAIAGPFGAGVGMGLGLFMGSGFGVKSDLSSLREMSFLVKALIRKSIATPINFIAGKEVVQDFVGYEQLQGKGFTERDVKNMKATIADMSVLLSWVALTFLTKAMFWDDDDEEDSTRRITHNLLINRTLQLSSSATSYMYPPKMWEQLVGNMAILKWTEDVNKTVEAINEYVEGNDILTTGSNAGESNLLNKATKVILPSLARDNKFGFGGQAERQFEKKSFDDWFWDSTKKESKIIKGKRALLRMELEKQGLPEKWVEKILNKRLPIPKNIDDTETKD
jgi:hypothetical protein